VRRRLIVAVGVALTMLPGGRTAGAWSNGVSGPDGFGTHDWVLRAALARVGDEVPWLCVGVALRATDDPDTVDGVPSMSSPWWHVYDRWGPSTYGDGPTAVARWFERARRQRAWAAPCEASRSVGIFAHLIADLAQPMHTDGWSSAEDRLHGAYETAVDRRCTSFSRCRYRFAYDGADVVAPKVRAIAVARHAHPWYDDLVRAFDRTGYARSVDAITRRQLNRAANAVADLLASL
jgi:hypothetical protein